MITSAVEQIADKVASLLAARFTELPTGTDPTDATDAPTSNIRRMLTAEQVLELIPVSRTTLFRLERDKVFPQGNPVTAHRKLWFEDEVVAWQKSLVDEDSDLRAELHRRARASNGKRKNGVIQAVEQATRKRRKNRRS